MIYKGLQTSKKSAGDKWSEEKYIFFSFFFKIPSDFTIKDLSIPLALVLDEVKASVPKVQHSMTEFDGHRPTLLATFRNLQPPTPFYANKSFSTSAVVDPH